MKAMEFARSIIEGRGGMDEYESREGVIWDIPERVAAALWTLKCLANPDCEGSAEALEAILERRRAIEAEKAGRSR